MRAYGSSFEFARECMIMEAVEKCARKFKGLRHVKSLRRIKKIEQDMEYSNIPTVMKMRLMLIITAAKR